MFSYKTGKDVYSGRGGDRLQPHVGGWWMGGETEVCACSYIFKFQEVVFCIKCKCPVTAFHFLLPALSWEKS